MKRVNLTKIIISALITMSAIALNPTGANAEWKQNNAGWWNTDGNSYSIGWKQIDGKWYYFDNNGYMVTNTEVNGYKIDNNGVWIQNTTINNTNNGIVINGNVSIDNIAQNNYDNTSEQSKTDKGYDGKDGFKKTQDGQYIYFEDGKMLNNTWKKFDEGYRHFGKYGYMDYNVSVDGFNINEQGLFPFKRETNKFLATEKGIFMEIKPYYSATMGISGDINYITHTYDVFGVKYDIEYQDVYQSSQNGELLSVSNKFNGHYAELDENNFDATKIITVGKFAERVNLK